MSYSVVFINATHVLVQFVHSDKFCTWQYCLIVKIASAQTFIYLFIPSEH